MLSPYLRTLLRELRDYKECLCEEPAARLIRDACPFALYYEKPRLYAATEENLQLVSDWAARALDMDALIGKEKP